MTIFSYKTHTGDGSTTTFDPTIDYLDESHILVYVDDVLQTDPTHYDWSGDNVVFVTAPIDGADILIQRVTPRAFADRGVDFTIQTFLDKGTLDTNQVWVWYMLQEAFETDDAGKVTPTGPEYIRYNSVTGEWSAARSSVATRLGGIADPTSIDDAATKDYVDSVANFGIGGVPQVFNIASGGGGTSFTLTDGADIDTEMLIVALENAGGDMVFQQPLVDFTVVKGNPDSTLVFTTSVGASLKITAQNMGSAKFTSSNLQDNSVEARHIADGAVTESKLADDAVATDKIADLAVTSAKIAALAVTGDEIAAATIALAKLKTSGFASAPGGGTDQALLIDEGSGDLVQRILAAADITDLATWLGAQTLDQLAAPTSDVAFGAQKITGLAEPTADTDGATKVYVDTAAGGNPSEMVRLVNETLGAAAQEWQIGTDWLDSGYLWYDLVISNWQVSGVVHDNSDIELWYEIASTWYKLVIQTEDADNEWIPGGSSTSPKTFTIRLSSASPSGTRMFFHGAPVNLGALIYGTSGNVATTGTVTNIKLRLSNAAYTLNTGLVAQAYGSNN